MYRRSTMDRLLDHADELSELSLVIDGSPYHFTMQTKTPGVAALAGTNEPAQPSDLI